MYKTADHIDDSLGSTDDQAIYIHNFTCDLKSVENVNVKLTQFPHLKFPDVSLVIFAVYILLCALIYVSLFGGAASFWGWPSMLPVLIG